MALKTCIEILVSDNGRKVIFVCLDDIKEIFKQILLKREEKFYLILRSVFRDQVNKNIYEKYSNYQGTAVFKLSKGKENLRIYCKVEKIKNEEKDIEIKYITLVKLHHKKDQKLSKKEISILRAIQNNEYEYKRWHQPD